MQPKEEKPKQQTILVPNTREYITNRSGAVRVASRIGMTRKERKTEQRAARKARIKELKARGK